MIAIIVVSHSQPLAAAAVALAGQMEGTSAVPMAIAAGTADGGLGTDATAVMAAIEELDNPDGVLVLVDLGSALLSADLALEMIEPDVASRVRLTPAPLVEGLVAAMVTAAGGGSLAECAAEAEAGLVGKRAHFGLGESGGAISTSSALTPTESGLTAIVTVTNQHGIHARPAALLVAGIRGFDATVRLRNVTGGSPWVSGGSLAQVTTLGAARGHQLEVEATGPQARQALYAVVALVENGFGETEEEAAGVTATGAVGVAAATEPIGTVAGAPRPAAPGYAIGPTRHLVGDEPVIPETEPGSPDQHRARLKTALAAVRDELAQARQRALQTSGSTEAAIFEAHDLMLSDPVIMADVENRIAAGAGPARAWSEAMSRLSAQVSALGDEYLRSRAVDVRGVSDQVLRQLLGVAAAHLTAPGILVADDLDPSQAGALDPNLVEGVILAAGSPTAHAAILARSKGIPMITGAGVAILRVPEGATVALDGTAGKLWISPNQATQQQVKAKIKARAKAARSNAKAAHRPARMAGGGPSIKVMANIGSVDDAIRATAAGADGCGLVRTEFLFNDADSAPSRSVQEEIYRAIAAAQNGRKVVFRTLDAGGDKPLRYAPMAAEANPFLGVRGIRFSLDHPAMLMDQLTALIAVARDYPVGIMFPMVAALSELRQARIMVARAAYQQGGCVPEQLQLGIMVEVPSVALKAASFAPMVDFFSVGTNDLTQYTLAAERGNPALASLADGLDPGVLALIKALCRAARGRSTVSVCGELAGDPAAVPVLLGLGVRTLSVAVPAIGEIKEQVRTVSKATARELARQALACSDAQAVREILRAPLWLES